MTTTEQTAPKQKPWQFQPGQSGNPKGRPKGARSVLAEDFLKALQDDFAVHGVAAIRTVRETDPVQYVKTIASILPKEMTLNINPLDEMTDDELIDRIRQLEQFVTASIAGFSGSSASTGEADSGEGLGEIRAH